MSSGVITHATIPQQRRFIRKVTLATAWGEGLDGYDLGIISVVIASIAKDLHMGAGVTGLIGASSLIGIFIGAPLFGYLTDRYGRHKMFLLDLVIFLIAGVAQALVSDGWVLFSLRLVLGIAVGAEYSIGAPMLAEFIPAHDRGRRLSLLEVFWYVGFLLAVIVGYAFADAGIHWRWTLATSAVPAAITLVARLGIPESPRWLARQGRTDEAREIVERCLGDGYYDAEAMDAEEPQSGGMGKLFAPGVRSRTLFVCTFWTCLVAPYFAIFTFAPQVLGALHLDDPKAATIATNSIALLGVTVGMVVIERIGRRAMLIPPFWVQTVALLVIGLWSGAPTWIVVVCFAAYAFFNSVSGNLTAVYPAEIFPTDVRTSGVGLAAAASRVGADGGTWLLPLGIAHLGIRACMLIGAAMCAGGALMSHSMAPETTGKALTRTSG